MDEEKAAAIVSPGDILFLNDRRGRITSLKGIYKAGLTEEIKKAKQSPPESNVPPISFRGSGLLPIF